MHIKKRVYIYIYICIYIYIYYTLLYYIYIYIHSLYIQYTINMYINKLVIFTVGPTFSLPLQIQKYTQNQQQNKKTKPDHRKYE